MDAIHGPAKGRYAAARGAGKCRRTEGEAVLVFLTPQRWSLRGPLPDFYIDDCARDRNANPIFALRKRDSERCSLLIWAAFPFYEESEVAGVSLDRRKIREDVAAFVAPEQATSRL